MMRQTVERPRAIEVAKIVAAVLLYAAIAVLFASSLWKWMG